MGLNTGKQKPSQTSIQDLVNRIDFIEQKIAQIEHEIRLQNDDRLNQYQLQNIHDEDIQNKNNKIEGYLIQVDQYIKDVSLEIGSIAGVLEKVQNNIKIQADNFYEAVNILRAANGEQMSLYTVLKDQFSALVQQMEMREKYIADHFGTILGRIEEIQLLEMQQYSSMTAQVDQTTKLLEITKNQISALREKNDQRAAEVTANFGETRLLNVNNVPELHSINKDLDDTISSIQASVSEIAALGLEANRSRQQKSRIEIDQIIRKSISDADAWISKNYIHKALTILEQTHALYPGDPALDLKLAKVMLLSGDISGAEGIVGPLVETQSPSNDAIFLLGKIRFFQNDYASAILHLEKAWELNPQDAEINLFLGKAFQKDQQLLKALQHWEKAAAINPRMLENEAEIRLFLEENHRIMGAT